MQIRPDPNSDSHHYSNQTVLQCSCLLKAGVVDRHGEEGVTLPFHQPHLDLGASSMIFLQKSVKLDDNYLIFHGRVGIIHYIQFKTMFVSKSRTNKFHCFKTKYKEKIRMFKFIFS